MRRAVRHPLGQDGFGALVPADLVKRSRAAQDAAVHTVNYTYLLFHTHADWPVKVKNPMMVTAPLEALRKTLQASRVETTGEMEEMLTMWTNGVMVDALAHKREDLGTSSYPAPPTAASLTLWRTRTGSRPW